jgi:hypothetical protein
MQGPDSLQKLHPGDDGAGIAGRDGDQREFPRADGPVARADMHGARREPDRDVAERHQIVIGRSRPAHQGAQLHLPEGLGQIVVGPTAKALDPFRPPAGSRQDQHHRPRSRAADDRHSATAAPARRAVSATPCPAPHRRARRPSHRDRPRVPTPAASRRAIEDLSFLEQDALVIVRGAAGASPFAEALRAAGFGAVTRATVALAPPGPAAPAPAVIQLEFETVPAD